MKAIATEEEKKINGRVIHFIQLGKLVQVNSTVSYGNMSFKYGIKEEVKQNREIFFSNLKLLINDKINKEVKVLDPILINPVMGKEIMLVDNKLIGTGWTDISPLKCDGLLLLRYPNKVIIPLGLVCADCAPVSIYIPSVNSLIMIHVSRKNIEIVQDALQIAYGIHLAAASHKPFHLILIVGPAGRYPYYREKEILIDIPTMIAREIVQFESQHSEDGSRLEVYFSQHLTTNSNIFFSNHILSLNQQPQKRFMSLTFLI